MAEIRPFRGWHYRGDVSSLIAPPYDILSAADKDALLAGSPDNIVAVDLPHVPPKEVGPDAEYQAAAAKLAALQESGVLAQDDRPAVYAYSQSYAWAGKRYMRRALICGVRATEFGQAVWPHEKTFAGPKADRLKLTELTGVQLSPIFGFFDDAAAVSEALWSAATGAPLACGELRGVREEIWAVTDPAVISRIAAGLADRKIFIADGHHRYTTALNYRNALAAAGRIDDEHEANFVMFTLVPGNDPGLLVLPTHRLISGLGDSFGCEDLAGETRDLAEWHRLEKADALLADPDAVLAPFGEGAMAFLDRRGSAAYVARLTDAAVMRRLAPDQVDPWRKLDVAILHRLFLDEYVARHATAELKVGYTAHGGEVAEALATGECDMAAVLQGTPLSAVRDIALAHSTMPHKSTYFYPKLATGMVLKPLT